MTAFVSQCVAPIILHYQEEIQLMSADAITDSICDKIYRAVYVIFDMIASVSLEIAYGIARCLDSIVEFWSEHPTESISLNESQNEDSPLEPHIPDMEELQNSSAEKIHALWRLNNETLIGIIAKKEIPQFGFHGTNALGVEGIQNSRQSGTNEDGGGYIWVASYDYQLDPITALADFYTIAEKGSSYTQDDDGGVFTIRTEYEQRCLKYICTNRYSKSGLYGEETPDRDLNTKAESQFLELIWRNNYDDGTQYTEKGEKILWDWEKKSTCSTKEFFPADEFHVKFNEDNYDETVKGLLKNRDRAFSEENMTQLYLGTHISNPEVDDNVKKYCLGQRFRAQELIFDAFKNLGVINPNKLQHKWTKYQQIGFEYMQKIDEITLISDEQLRKIH